MAVPCPPPAPHFIDWGTLLVGFGLGIVGSLIGSISLAWATSVWGRRDHQFTRMLREVDEIRHDIERCDVLCSAYWVKPGAHDECPRLESEILSLNNKIVGALSLIRSLDPKRFAEIAVECEEDYLEALTGGNFQVRTREPDSVALERVKRFGNRLGNKLAKCSAKPSARHLLNHR